MGEQRNEWLHGEPRIKDVLADPIIHTIMRHDGISDEDLRIVVRTARARLRGEPSTRHEAA